MTPVGKVAPRDRYFILAQITPLRRMYCTIIILSLS
jgi:hypothetical protein